MFSFFPSKKVITIFSIAFTVGLKTVCSISFFSYNFHTFGHAVREVTVSRGNKEGNNAFLMSETEKPTRKENYLLFALKNNVSYEFIKSFFLKRCADVVAVSLEF